MAMKFVARAVIGFAVARHIANAFVPQPNINERAWTTTPSLMTLHMAKESGNEKTFWGSSITAFVAGLTLASQIAVAQPQSSPSYAGSTSIVTQQSVLVAAFGFGGGSNVDTLDFSLPSYDEASKGSSTRLSTGGGTPPAFNPFGDFTPQIVTERDSTSSSGTSVENKAAAEVAKAEAKVAEEARKIESKAAEEARKIERKVADEAKKAEAKAAADAKKVADEAKKLEKEARRRAELEKQRYVVERAKQGAKDAAASAAKMDTSDFGLPEIKVPEFNVPDFGFKKPEINLPSFKAPELPDFKKPDISFPEIKKPDINLPTFKAPELPKLSLPKLGMPKTDSKDGYNLDIPKVSAPTVEAPKFEAPSFPKIGLPSLPNPFGGGQSDSSTDNKNEIEPQAVRDERAREARKVYLSYDEDAKVVEQKAREARELANEKKKLAGIAKDEACETRPGGKWICLRNPFTAGF